MKFFVLVISIYVTGASSAHEDLKCKQFKTGKFTIVEQETDVQYIIERNDSLQTERDLSSGSTSTYRVTWLNDCEYQLNIIEGDDDLMNFYSSRTLTIRVLEIYENGYKFEGQLEGFDYRPTQIVRWIE